MKKLVFIFIPIVLVLLNSCARKESSPVVQLLHSGGINSVGPYLTKDNKGNTVLCWMEQDGKDSLYRLKYAVYNGQEDKFGTAVTVPGSAGCSISAESMGKVAFKADGTVMAIYAKRFLSEKSPYAGAIYYSFSSDKGKSWSDSQFLHSDTAHAYGRSFFDVVTLKDGELAAVWLDGRFGKSIKGSALYFNRTASGKGFGLDSCLDKGTCECCRTDLLCDEKGNLHLAYRSIQFPSVLSGKQVRDMVYKSSIDNGKTFSESKAVSKDNWEIEGCPHSGPSLAVNANGGANVIWFTAGGSAGLYYTTAPARGADFRSRTLITATGRHPQLLSLADGRTVMVCEEMPELATEHTPAGAAKMDHGSAMKHSGGGMNHGPAGSAKIVLRMIADGKTEQEIALSDGEHPDNHAVLKKQGDHVLAAWVREGHSRSEICFARVDIRDHQSKNL
ncbi:sialidase family protein [Pedobacter ginsengisoli]|uniref:sialidase family protein n=1 Tax=Pedobacter ginsengisoli TaxID=363852 RepID=UPI00254E43D5|nr:sialidase family protein [Pedobacter ginsengisoli]